MTRCGPVPAGRPAASRGTGAGQVAGRRQEVELRGELLGIVLHHDERPPAEARQVVGAATTGQAAPSASRTSRR